MLTFIWILLKLTFLAAASAGLIAFAVVWAICCIKSVPGIRKAMGAWLSAIYAFCAAIFFIPGFYIVIYAMKGSSAGYRRFFVGMGVFYFLVFITRKEALPEFLKISKRQIGEWNARPNDKSAAHDLPPSV